MGSLTSVFSGTSDNLNLVRRNTSRNLLELLESDQEAFGRFVHPSVNEMDVDLPDDGGIGMYSSDSDEDSREQLRDSLGVHTSTTHSHIQPRLMSVFRMLVRNGEIDVMSSDEYSEEDEDESSEYVLPADRRRVRPPKEIYEPDLETINKNDISLTLKGAPVTQLAGRGTGIPSFLANRELGAMRSLHGGFGSKQRTKLASHFLPNSVRRVSNYGYKAFCGTYSKDGSIFLSASQDRSIRIYDTSKGKFREIKKLSAKDVGWSVLDTAFSPDGQYVAYSSWSESIHICKLNGDTDHHDSLSLTPDSRRFCIFSIAFSEDGNEILGGANDGFLYIFDRDLNQRVLKINAHEEDVNAVAFADDTSHILFSVSDDALVKVWDRRCLNEAVPRPVGFFAGHIDGITFVDSKLDGRYLLTNSKDQSIKLWDLRAFGSSDTIGACRDAMEKNRWDYRWQRVPKKLCVPRDVVKGDSSVMTYRGHSVLNTLIRCRFSPPHSTSQRFVYTGCAAGRVVIYDLLTGEVVKILDGHDSCVRDVSWHPFFTEIVSTSWDGSLGLWKCESRHALSENDATILGIKTNSEQNPRRSLRLAARGVSLIDMLESGQSPMSQ